MIPMADLRAQYRAIKSEVGEAARERVHADLAARGVQTDVHYPI